MIRRLPSRRLLKQNLSLLPLRTSKRSNEELLRDERKIFPRDSIKTELISRRFARFDWETEEKILWQGDHQHEAAAAAAAADDSDAVRSKGTIDSRRVVVYAVKYAGSVPTKACLLIIKKAASLKIL
jgi:hypothetical protein